LVGKITEGAKTGDERMESGDRNNKPIDVMKDEYRREMCLGTGGYTNEPLGLEFGEPDILTTSVLINKDYQLGSVVKLGDNQQNDSLLYGNNKTGNYQLDYNYQETREGNTHHNINLSHVSEQQKYLKVTPSDEKGDDSIKLGTINGKEYFVKLKELELNEFGEFVMTLKPSTNRCFIGLPKNIEENYL
jgi:hypothetical protein